MSDAPEAGGSSAMRRSLRRCDGATGCPCLPDPDEPPRAPPVAVYDTASMSTQLMSTVEDASVDSSNHWSTTKLLSDSQDSSDSTVQLSTGTRLNESLQPPIEGALQPSIEVTEVEQPSVEVDDTATTHRVALQEEENRMTMRPAERICNLMFPVYCLVGVIMSLVAAMVLGTN